MLTLLEAILVVLVVLAVIGLYLYYRIKKKIKELGKLSQLDLQKKGFTEMPAVPVSVTATLETIVSLGLRAEECKMAKLGLSNEYKLNEHTHTAYTFMYENDKEELSKKAKQELIEQLTGKTEEELILSGKIEKLLSGAEFKKAKNIGNNFTDQFLTSPEQFTMSWTNYYEVYKNNLHKASEYAATLTDDQAATDQFWPMISENGLAYNLLFLNKVNDKDMEEINIQFENGTENNYLNEIQYAGRLYAIDLRIFEKWSAQQAYNYKRWTPGSWILLEQDVSSKKLKPISIRISGHNDKQDTEVFHRHRCTKSAWIFALAAARCSVTVYGIWIGHVYHWHIVTAAMQMTMFQNMNEEHPIRKLLDPQSKSLIGFNDSLLLLWSEIGPPTSFTSPELFLDLTNSYADGREFFDDDPTNAIKRLGLNKDDFTDKEEWDRYPLVKDLLYFWRIAGDFASSFTEHTYKDDDDVSKDKALQDWMTASSDVNKGNVRGLPYMSSKRELTRVLQSLIYRVVVHGNSRQMHSLNPALCFVSNYPPCLQDTEVPKPSDEVVLSQLLRHLPNTGTIGEMMTFYYIFIYSAPNDLLMPINGNETNLYFDDPNDPRNKALIKFRNEVEQFIEKDLGENALKYQWPSSIET